MIKKNAKRTIIFAEMIDFFTITTQMELSECFVYQKWITQWSHARTPNDVACLIVMNDKLSNHLHLYPFLFLQSRLSVVSVVFVFNASQNESTFSRENLLPVKGKKKKTTRGSSRFLHDWPTWILHSQLTSSFVSVLLVISASPIVIAPVSVM